MHISRKIKAIILGFNDKLHEILNRILVSKLMVFICFWTMKMLTKNGIFPERKENKPTKEFVIVCLFHVHVFINHNFCSFFLEEKMKTYFLPFFAELMFL